MGNITERQRVNGSDINFTGQGLSSSRIVKSGKSNN